MVLGRAGYRLEAQKFALYLAVPITASLAFNEPSVQKHAADYFQFMKYPSNPSTNLKKEFDALKRQREEEREWEERMKGRRERGREEYANQLRRLNADRGAGADDADGGELSEKRGWFGWLRAWGRGESAHENDQSEK